MNAGTKRDILYVDDDPDNLIVFEAGFEDDYNVHTANSATEALAMLQTNPVPLVVSDQRMPGMTGVEMFSIIREKYPHIQRVIITGFSDPDAIVDAINQGHVFQFVRKPWRKDELSVILQRALEAHDMLVENSALTERMLVSERCSMLGEATGRIAHEMGNQLCMLPLIEMIEDEYPENEQLMQVTRFAREMYEHLEVLLDEVKSFMRFEGNDIATRPVPLGDAISEMVSFLRFNSTVPHDRLSVELRAEPTVMGNKLKLHQVLMNLIKNAAHAIEGRDDGRIRITVDTDMDEALICVSDNGCGIPPETLAHIWEPFFTTKGERGNGLGLDICRRLIESHGGETECESEVGSGTTFTLRLPLHDDAPTADTPVPQELACV